MSCETTLRRLEEGAGPCWIEPALVCAIYAATVAGWSMVDCGGRRQFTVRGTPDEVHRMLFPEESEVCPPEDYRRGSR